MKLVQEKIQKNLLDFKLNKNVYRRTIMIVDYSKLINHLNDKEINVVDVGVRNGMSLLGDLSKFSNLYGFEANPEEYQKLLNNKTDLQQSGGVLPFFKKTNISEEQHIRISIILCALGFNSLEKYCLQKSNRLSQKEVDFFFYQVNKKNYKKRIFYYWNLLPILIKRMVLDKFYRF